MHFVAVLLIYKENAAECFLFHVSPEKIGLLHDAEPHQYVFVVNNNQNRIEPNTIVRKRKA